MAFPAADLQRNSRVGSTHLDTADETAVAEVQRIERRGH